MWKLAKRIFCATWNLLNFTRTAIANLLLLVIIGGLVAVFFIDTKPSVPDKSILYIDLAGSVVEQASVSGKGSAVMRAVRGHEPQTVLADVLDALKHARKDAAVTGVYMSLDDLGSVGLASIREITQAMRAFRTGGKKITVWSSSFSQKQYAIASAADEVFLHPMGAVLLTGIGGQRFYWGETLKNAGVTVHVFKAGAYKTFPEVFVRREPSDESLAADAFWMNDSWTQLTDSIQSSRGLLPATVQNYINTLPEALAEAAGRMSQVALKANLVDGLRSNDEVLDLLIERQGGNPGKDKLKTVNYLDYLAARDEGEGKGVGIALITLEGDIKDGVGTLGEVGSRSAVKLIREARRDKDVAAVVIRIDSPGGSAVASELIRREIELVKKAGKPVVISMGDYAASGGYWISLAGSRIVADPATITGSIGVFGMMPTIEKALEKFSIGTGGMTTAWLAGASNPALPMNPRFETMLELMIGNTYSDFIKLVAESRNLSVSQVEKLAEGRVYTGRQAKALGLADELGGIESAKELAKKLANLPEKAPEYVYTADDEPLLSWVKGLAVKVFSEIDPLARVSSELGLKSPAGALERLTGLTRSAGEPMAHCLCTRP
ncbi:MAG TPA: signal peptide peptidase SppA [Sutterella sp.]|nr:signal peptide peptidase SppA [Sutterella sp.]